MWRREGFHPPFAACGAGGRGRKPSLFRRTFCCAVCGLKLNSNLNAALNRRDNGWPLSKALSGGPREARVPHAPGPRTPVEIGAAAEWA